MTDLGYPPGGYQPTGVIFYWDEGLPGGYLFQPVAVAVVEGGEVLAVDVEHRHDGAVNSDGYHYLAARGGTAGYVAGELLYIGHQEGAFFFPGGAAHAGTEGYVHAGHGSLEGTEQQFVVFHTVVAGPPEMESLVQ